MKYTVSIYGGGHVNDIISSLRDLADKLELNKEEYLVADGFEAVSLVMDLDEFEED